jgi:hypothetical protein
LNRNRASHGIDGARELDQHAIAGGLDYTAVILGDSRIDDLAPVRLQGSKRADLISTHQARVTGDISRHHCRQTPLDALARHETSRLKMPGTDPSKHRAEIPAS